MTEIPQNPWEVVSVDFGEPYPDGHYNRVVIDKRTRYLEVEKLHTTACKQTKEKLKKIFSTHGIPRRLESDNGTSHGFCGISVILKGSCLCRFVVTWHSKHCLIISSTI
jgi:hypothetical protein